MGRFRKVSATKNEWWQGKHRFEHWYRDNTVHFLTSRVSDRSHVFLTPGAAEVFWDPWDHWTKACDIRPLVTTLMSNHYHTVAYLRRGASLGPFMQKLHGSLAKLVNDLLPSRIKPFWRTNGNKDYFDGCLRNEKQLRQSYAYTRDQSVRASLAKSWDEYLHTRVTVDLDRAVNRATELGAIPISLPYQRYQKP
jgi:hypothetical protein